MQEAGAASGVNNIWGPLDRTQTSVHTWRRTHHVHIHRECSGSVAHRSVHNGGEQ